ncbi:hypothetical protein SAICODRAFT_71126 [Saitoella complicata NRRL Y-17804]|uniref:Uncharacterized protein n=1 Tax=Saitoella complicata (strain BCRC 22490 / CBS 7301 / JCM 7358 / NBRC 10748 / NRRL Y-17804) TaxID=698492 RepID=A0A0E9N8L7_SAICN|nr:uncharacterized protein SAICODRAFT_71126 [Saitoella complicata NRRL Y-17804]ODQ53119.1 hypothetical protein SAICODRAFT_71126 [Saitoella complicata NRRL Y-17804]GAO46242.1 hypothetical protein G7K_0477-t1 [Saitoella complicata NRRL Y-17804]
MSTPKDNRIPISPTLSSPPLDSRLTQLLSTHMHLPRIPYPAGFGDYGWSWRSWVVRPIRRGEKIGEGQPGWMTACVTRNDVRDPVAVNQKPSQSQSPILGKVEEREREQKSVQEIIAGKKGFRIKPRSGADAGVAARSETPDTPTITVQDKAAASQRRISPSPAPKLTTASAPPPTTAAEPTQTAQVDQSKDGQDHKALSSPLDPISPRIPSMFINPPTPTHLDSGINMQFHNEDADEEGDDDEGELKPISPSRPAMFEDMDIEMRDSGVSLAGEDGGWSPLLPVSPRLPEMFRCLAAQPTSTVPTTNAGTKVGAKKEKDDPLAFLRNPGTRDMPTPPESRNTVKGVVTKRPRTITSDSFKSEPATPATPATPTIIESQGSGSEPIRKSPKGLVVKKMKRKVVEDDGWVERDDGGVKRRKSDGEEEEGENEGGRRKSLIVALKLPRTNVMLADKAKRDDVEVKAQTTTQQAILEKKAVGREASRGRNQVKTDKKEAINKAEPTKEVVKKSVSSARSESKGSEAGRGRSPEKREEEPAKVASAARTGGSLMLSDLLRGMSTLTPEQRETQNAKTAAVLSSVRARAMDKPATSTTTGITPAKKVVPAVKAAVAPKKMEAFVDKAASTQSMEAKGEWNAKAVTAATAATADKWSKNKGPVPPPKATLASLGFNVKTNPLPAPIAKKIASPAPVSLGKLGGAKASPSPAPISRSSKGEEKPKKPDVIDNKEMMEKKRKAVEDDSRHGVKDVKRIKKDIAEESKAGPAPKKVTEKRSEGTHKPTNTTKATGKAQSPVKEQVAAPMDSPTTQRKKLNLDEYRAAKKKIGESPKTTDSYDSGFGSGNSTVSSLSSPENRTSDAPAGKTPASSSKASPDPVVAALKTKIKKYTALAGDSKAQSDEFLKQEKLNVVAATLHGLACVLHYMTYFEAENEGRKAFGTNITVKHWQTLPGFIERRILSSTVMRRRDCVPLVALGRQLLALVHQKMADIEREILEKNSGSMSSEEQLQAYKRIAEYRDKFKEVWASNPVPAEMMKEHFPATMEMGEKAGQDRGGFRWPLNVVAPVKEIVAYGKSAVEEQAMKANVVLKW